MTKVSKETYKPTAVWGGAFNAFDTAIKRVRANPVPLIFYAAVYLVIVLLELYASAPGEKESLVRVSSYESLAYLLFMLALPTYGLAMADRKRISLSDFMRFRADTYFAILVVTILYSLIVAGSFLLLILPAVWTIAWFAFSILIVADKNLGPIEALKESKRLARDHRGKVWGIVGVTIVFSIGASLVYTLPVVGQFVGPLVSAVVAVLSISATALLYRWLRHHDV